MPKTKLNKKKLYEQAVKAIADENNLIYMEDVYCALCIGHETFYKMFPPESKEYESIKSMLNNNKRRNTFGRRKAWEATDDATLQIAYYKLNATEEEKESLGVKTAVKNTDVNEFELEIP